MKAKELDIDYILRTETDTDKLFSSEHGTGIVYEVVRDGLVIKDVMTKEKLLVKDKEFHYESYLNLFHDGEDEELAWVVQYDRETKEVIS